MGAVRRRLRSPPRNRNQQSRQTLHRNGAVSRTDIVSPPDDPVERLKWARGLLRDFSSPEGRGAVSAAALRAVARSIISELDPSVQADPNRTRRERANAV